MILCFFVWVNRAKDQLQKVEMDRNHIILKFQADDGDGADFSLLLVHPRE
ncbi:hypothetical protein SAMN05421639_105205 [Chryseobacterium shigense]|uniref:Uncharacterized protein n=1 Tax=Chryseobacterium shigense TaxID=297244 RepID=A0A1N7J781_9FLAO|nr:hypothetical protein SAMN05421639_105205 [Chryseobacterium shigense]